MRKLYFIRHGESQAQVDGNWATADSLLSETGRKQAKIAGAQALELGHSFDVILCSPYTRAQETAQLFAQAFGYPIDSIVTFDGLRERYYGAFEHGESSAEFFKHHTYRDIDDIHGAETIAALQKRAEQVLEEIKKMPEDKVLLVSHAAFGRALRRVVKKIPPAAEYEGDRDFHQIPNAELFELL